MSWLSKHVFHPITAAIAHAASSSHPATAAAGKAAENAVGAVVSDVSGGLHDVLSGGSAAASGSKVIADLEHGLGSVVEGYVTAVAGSGAMGSVEVSAAHTALVFAEQHAQAFLASLFHHAKKQVAASAPH